MPSPFPGMDPFLEHPDEFGQFHDGFIVHLQEELQARLPSPYFAKTGQRIWVEVSERLIGPDVAVFRPEHRGSGPGQTAVLPGTSRSVVIQVEHDEEKENFIEIYRREGSDNRLVCSIELLSPNNKTPGETAQGLYLKKQQDLLRSQVHLIEIDLLRGGRHSTAVPLNALREKAGPFDYHICCHRFDRFNEFQVYPILLTEPLPTLVLPLLGEDRVEVSLQEVFTQTYDRAGFLRWLVYDAACLTPLVEGSRLDWVKGVLQERKSEP